ncbi:hypothetical protein ACIPRI_08735 [Variovorax sp. LARHSF232]
MAAKYILPLLALVFLGAALFRLERDGYTLAPASRTWLAVAAIFGLVSAWLWWSAEP